ncbi:MAG: hypothetical protein ACJ8OJ_00640 [Povalibacter sp.]
MSGPEWMVGANAAPDSGLSTNVVFSLSAVVTLEYAVKLYNETLAVDVSNQ